MGNNKKPKDPNKPKNAPSSYLLYCNDVRARFQEENKGMKISQISKLIGAEWKTLSDEDKKQYVDKSAELRAEWNEKMVEYKTYLEVLQKWNDEQMKNEKEDENNDNDNDKNEDNKDKVEEVETEEKSESDKENESRGKKRKHSADEDSSDLEPPQKKRKISPKKKKAKKKRGKKAKKQQEEEE